MPCGGVYPLAHHFAGGMFNPADLSHGCWVCHKVDPPPELFCDEWDTYLHRACLWEFLRSDEGKIVIEHGHDIVQGLE